MPEVKVQHNLKEADKLPARVAVPSGEYDSLIVAVPDGLTKTTPPLKKFSCCFRLVKDKDGKTDCAGRQVYQDYVYELSADAEINGREAFRIRQLLDATGVAYVERDGGFAFNTDHLLNKGVRITVSQNVGKNPQLDGTLPIYNRVDRVDTAQKLNEAEVI